MSKTSEILRERQARVEAAGYDTRSWGDFELKSSEALGSQGYAGTGTKIHVLRIETITAITGENRYNRKTGERLIVTALCNGNGQFNGRVFEDLDRDVTCTKCAKRIGF